MTSNENQPNPCDSMQSISRDGRNGFAFLTSSLDNVAQQPQPVNFHFHAVACLQRSHPGGGAGEDQVARLQRHHRRDVRDQHADVEDHVTRGGQLPHLPVDAAGDQRVGGIEVGVHPGTEWAERVEAFGARPLAVGLLQVAGGDVIPDGVAQHIVPRRLGSGVPSAFADDHHQLRFMLHLLGLRRKQDGAPRSEDRGRRLEEDQWDLWDFRPVFLGVFHIIAPHADDLARRGRRQQADLLKRNFRLEPFVRAEQVALDLADLFLVQPAVSWSILPGLKTNESHGASR